MNIIKIFFQLSLVVLATSLLILSGCQNTSTGKADTGSKIIECTQPSKIIGTGTGIGSAIYDVNNEQDKNSARERAAQRAIPIACEEAIKNTRAKLDEQQCPDVTCTKTHSYIDLHCKEQQDSESQRTAIAAASCAKGTYPSNEEYVELNILTEEEYREAAKELDNRKAEWKTACKEDKSLVITDKKSELFFCGTPNARETGYITCSLDVNRNGQNTCGLPKDEIYCLPPNDKYDCFQENSDASPEIEDRDSQVKIID